MLFNKPNDLPGTIPIMRKLLFLYLVFIASWQIGQSQVALSIVSGGNIGNVSKFVIDKNSVLQLNGTTNVSSFSCKCKEAYRPQSFSLRNSLSDILEFTATSLPLEIAALDCGNKKMNSDMQKALNAQTYPKIKVELLKVQVEEDCFVLDECVEDNLTTAKVYTQISMNGKSKYYWINVEVRKEAAHRLFVKGQKRLNMVDFGIKPPEVFFGAVKVNSAIDIVFDMGISLTK